MSAHWFGDPAVFAFGITELDCPPLGDLANTYSWCELTIACDGQELTRHVFNGTVYESLAVPAAPIAEWIGIAWNSLIGEERLIGGGNAISAHDAFSKLDDATWDENFETIDEFIRTHALYRAHGGLLLPNVFFWRRGNEMDVSWRASASGTGERLVRFTSSGQARIPAAAFFEACRNFVRKVAELVSHAPEESFLRGQVEDALRRVTSLRDTDLLAARVGRNPEEFGRWLKKRTRQQEPIDALAEAYGPEVRLAHWPEQIDSPIARAARSASPAFSVKDHQKLIELGTQLRSLPVAKKLAGLRERVLAHCEGESASLEDWERGYGRAQAVREVLRNKTGRVEVEDILSSGGCNVVGVELDDIETDGTALWTADGQALVAANVASPRTSSPWGRRAMLAHELYHLLFDASSTQFFGECTSDWSPTVTERQANAFSAELLLPSNALKKRLPKTTALEDWHKAVTALLEEYGTGWELTIRHLRNHQLIGHAMAKALLDDLKR